MARTYKKRSTKNRSIKKRGGGMFDFLMGAQYLRKGKFDNYLEERLVLSQLLLSPVTVCPQI